MAGDRAPRGQVGLPADQTTSSKAMISLPRYMAPRRTGRRIETMATFEMRPTVGRLARAGAVFFALWGVLHAVVGLTGTLGYLRGGRVDAAECRAGAGRPRRAGLLDGSSHFRCTRHLGCRHDLAWPAHGLLAGRRHPGCR